MHKLIHISPQSANENSALLVGIFVPLYQKYFEEMDPTAVSNPELGMTTEMDLKSRIEENTFHFILSQDQATNEYVGFAIFGDHVTKPNTIELEVAYVEPEHRK